MKQTPYTIFLSQEELSRFERLSPYEYMTETSSPSVFQKALYPVYNYYTKRTPKIEIYTSSSSFAASKKTLTIKTTKNKFTLILQKIFPRKNYLYLNEREALLDIERSWNIIENSKNLKEYTHVLFFLPWWTKLVYAYRINTIYGTEIKDLTTY